jgi:hypothetical protein
VIADDPLRLADSADEGADEAVLAALNEMTAALRALVSDADTMIERARVVAAQRRDGQPWVDVLFTDDARGVTGSLAEAADRIGRANSGVRRAQAAVLYRNGMSMERIGALLGISRQRVAILLRAVLD